ncbi:hypothetical protein PG985_003580 [Apiospora marii]|uniref:uncharacterized protein n=1 Tax=Apiospora marii TaxID=335849 RepID=UPI00312E0AE7
MEHVAEYHGKAVGQIDVRVLDPVGRKIVIPETAEQFWAFPKEQGWEVEEDFSLKAKSNKRCDLAEFLQAWLFFGLCFTVVQINSEPILSYKDLVEENSLSTAELNNALKRWFERELRQHNNKEDRNGTRLRMIQVAYLLDYARQVIRSHCACTGDGITVKYGVDAGPLYVADDHVLVLMCLGEALCEMKAQITRKCNVEMAGWHSAEDQEGWGPPRYVLKCMKDKRWCPRAVRLLRGQFSANATLLVSAYHACREREETNSTDLRHRECTADICLEKCENDQHLYCCRHVCEDSGCDSFGPDMDKVLKTLTGKTDGIPLLSFQDQEEEQGKISLKVLQFDPMDKEKLKFVAISHVWSHGWGNEQANKLNYCQLKLIQRQIKRATGSQDTPFWMDTLVVPVAHKEARKKAIRQIHSVFNSSTHTIVIDNGLLSMKEGHKAETAMKVLSSGWMRRLWTLQEAHLSKSIHFAFKETEPSAQSLYGLHEIERRLVTAEDPAPVTSMRGRIQLSKVIMSRHEYGQVVDGSAGKSASEAGIILGDAWHAARWRTTSRAEHETLVIATLLGLNTRDSEIEDAGLLDPGEDKKDDTWRQGLVQVFWERFHKTYRGAIPAGIIFLPGDKINIRGYAWAPKTWLSAHEVTYPEPMSFWNSPTELSADGLLVHYPGFILHTDCPKTRNSILGTATNSGENEYFSFPVDRTLKEWYSVTKAEERSYCNLAIVHQSTSKLAIIASRAPSELPREIALLVEIKKEDSSPRADCGPGAIDYYVKVIRRLYIWRHAKDSTEVARARLKNDDFGSTETQDFLVGEKFGPRQRWWVDGYVTASLDPEVPTRQDAQDAASWGGIHISLLRRFTRQSEPRRPTESGMEAETDTPAQPPRPARGWSFGLGWGSGK